MISFPILLFLALLTFFAAYYLTFIVAVISGLGKLHFEEGSAVGHKVSVVIAARNESDTIEQCLRSIFDQDYPADKFEAIVVDDASTDATSVVLEQAKTNFPFRLISLKESKGKPKALAVGIEQAQGEIIVTTDADSQMSNTWLRTLIGTFTKETAFVAGPVIETSTGHLLSRLSALEFLGIIITAAGLIGIRRPIICNGANMAFRKSVFQKAEGYGARDKSCDDEILMQRIQSRELGAIRFAFHPAALVQTKGPTTINEFLLQRARWARKRGHYEDGSLLLFLVGLYCFFALSLISFLAAFMFPVLFCAGLLVFAFKMVVDALAIERGSQKLRIHIRWGDFLIAELFHIPYIVATAFVGQVFNLTWKGRSLGL